MKEEILPVLIQNFPATKSQIAAIHAKGREFLLEGNLNDREVLEFAAKVKAMISVGEMFAKDELLKDLFLEAYEKYGEKSFTLSNASYRGQEVGVTYDFSECGDEEYNELKQQMDELKAKIKEKEEFLKTIKPGMEIYSKEGTMLSPPHRKAKKQVVITLKK